VATAVPVICVVVCADAVFLWSCQKGNDHERNKLTLAQ
jgi:hypothetical protein